MSENITVSSSYELMRERASGVFALFAVFLTFLLPLKFGMMTGVPEVATALPSDIIAILLVFWPPMLFSLLSSLLLLGVLLTTPSLGEKRGGRIGGTLLIPLSWLLLFLSVLPGFINASTLDFPIIQTGVFAGFAAFALAVYRLIDLRPELKIWLINAIVLSTVLTLFLALNQYLYGFKETLDYIYSKEVETGNKVSESMMSRLLQTRLFATFSICNSLAAHIILTLPICIWGILNSKLILKSVVLLSGVNLLFMVMPPVTSQLLYLPITFIVLFGVSLFIFRFPEKWKRYISIFVLIAVLVLILFILRHTYSRGAFLGLGCAFVFSSLLIPVKLRYKVIFIFFIAICSILLITSDYAERSFASVDVRFDYYSSALKMFMHHPFFGTGWGDFFHEYTKMKTFHGDEAPHTPHNMVLSFASQAGIGGLFASLLVLLAPFYVFYKKAKEYKLSLENPLENEENPLKWFNIAVITGWCAWAIHSLLDFNIQVPGTVAVGIILVLIMNSSIFKNSKENCGDEYENLASKGGSKYLVLWYGCVPLVALTAYLFAYHQLKFESSIVRLKKYANLSVIQSKRAENISDAQFEVLLNRSVAMAQYSPIPWLNAADYARRNNTWGKVEMYLTEALKRAPERASLYYRLYEAQAHLGKRFEAEKNLKKAAELFPHAYSVKGL